MCVIEQTVHADEKIKFPKKKLAGIDRPTE